MIKIVAFILELGCISYSLNSCNGQSVTDLQHDFTDSSLTISNNGNDKLINETDQETPFEMTVTSKPIVIFKRSDSNTENDILPKKKPILYSWWMPNMTMMGSTQSTLKLPSTAMPMTPNNPVETIQEITANPSSVNIRPRSTVKPRQTLKPRTRLPSVISKSTGFPSSTLLPPISTSETATFPSVSNNSPKITTTEMVHLMPTVQTNPNGFIDTLELKKKLAFAVKKLGVVLTAAGTVGEIALGPPEKGTFSRIAGQVGSFAINAASQIGPVLKTVVKQAPRPVTVNPAKGKSIEPSIPSTSSVIPLETQTLNSIDDPSIQMVATSDCDCKNIESKDQLKPSPPTPKVSMMMSGMMPKKSRRMNTKGSKSSSGTVSTTIAPLSNTFLAIFLQIFCSLFVIQ